MILDKLFKPISYIRIKHYEKSWFDFILPLGTTLLFFFIIYCLSEPIRLLGKEGLVSLVNGLLQILAGFYIASMAAIATFNKEGMDDIMDGTPPTLNGVELTRRQFLTYLFGYLAFCSICLYFIGGFAQLASLSLFHLVSLSSPFLKILLVGLYIFAISNIMYTTVLGMHFMIDKIHRKKVVIRDNKANETSDN
ncbi:hypothetical protein I6F48_05045 [Pseudoalteromonas sp. SWYJ118]|uniref:hypothetical protein n=1 Tax=Pseudoalteromonas sp. SWYJ118 TaxID=2792062 RepID=UPI0018CC952D|nr:hypothetical protein [Pseudoalteromonas sp. SWYJ118]MBH0074932.1 hypothetical protein [Pseudoalteromonas sp. SWYJ118]